MRVDPHPGDPLADDQVVPDLRQRDDRHLGRRDLARVGDVEVEALAGGREDITRAAYPERYDREYLDARRQAFRSSGETVALPDDRDEPASGAAALAALLSALKAAGALAALVVPLYSGKDPDIEVVRLVVPPLRDLIRE